MRKKKNVHSYHKAPGESHITQEKWEPDFLYLKYFVTGITWLDSFIFFLQYIFVKSLFLAKFVAEIEILV